ncbi:MAG: branched-chain amino acid ABC transporter substrate-binding protein [Bacillota bacterium]
MKLKIASVSPLSGGQSTLGTAIANGVKLAIMDRQADLEKAGIQLEAFPQDDQATETNGPTIANRLAGDKEVIGVVGTLNSGVAKTMVKPLNDAKLVMVSPANTAVVLTESGWGNYNRIVARDDAQGPAGARAVLNTLKAKSVMVLHDKTEYGQGIAAEFVKEAKKIGLTVVNGDGEGINPKDSDFSAVVTKLLSSKAEALYYGGIYDTAALIFKQAHEKGFKGKYMGADGLDAADIVTNSGGAANSVYYTSVADNVYGSADGKAFVDRYKKAFNADPPTYAVYGYDAAGVIINALLEYAKANPGKTPSREEIMKAVRATKGYKGLAGEVNFDAKGDNPSAKVYLFQIQNSKYPGASLGEIKK